MHPQWQQHGGIVHLYAQRQNAFPVAQPPPHAGPYPGVYMQQPVQQPVQQALQPPLQQIPPERHPRHSTQLREISLQYSYEELSVATKNWSDSERLGSGSYGSVFKGELEDGSEMAIKAIDLKALGAESSGFEEEVQMLSKFRHPNLVTLLGWAKHDFNRYLVYELLSGGDCFQRLQKSKKPSAQCPFHWFERLSVCLDASAGLSHMHNSKPKAFHRDIKSANILLDRHGTAKMADFGLSCTSARSDSLHVTVRTISGTPGYACPIYSRTGRVTEGGEVYSFGMVMLELLTGLAPATADATRPGGIAYQVADAVKQDSPGALDRCMAHLDAKAAWPSQLAREMTEMALRAVHAQDEERPRFVELVKSLRKMNERFPKPSQPSAFAPPPAQHLVDAAPVQPQGPVQVPQDGDSAKQLQQQLQQQQQPVKIPSPVLVALPHSHLATFGLEFLSASGVETGNLLPAELQCIFLKPNPNSSTDGNGMFAFAVGRIHQQRVFEAWVPDQALQCCISRTAFEVVCDRQGGSASLIVRGQGLVSVDGRVAPREAAVPLHPRSEILFAHGVEGTMILCLRYLPASELSEKAEKAEKAEKVDVEEPTSPPPRRTVRRAEEEDRENRENLTGPAVQDIRSPSARPRSSWVLACTHVEGLTAGQLAELRSAVRDIHVTQMPMMLGRLHQNQFEALVKAAERPKLASFISRAHGKLEADPDGTAVLLTNVSPSNNPLYVDDHHVLPGQTQRVENGQMVGFAREESGNHVHFLKFQVLRVDARIDRFLSPPGRRLEAAHMHSRSSGEAHLSPPRDARAQRPTQAESSSPQEVHLLTLSPPRRKVSRDLSSSSCRVSRSPRCQEEAKTRPTSSTVHLELSGEGVKEDAPLADRQIGPVSLLQLPDHTLFVGRKHQPELLKRSVAQDCLPFMSRDHFSICFSRGQFQMRTLTSNPIWRFRSCAEPIELQRGDPVDLQTGDRIALGTGNDNSPESAVQSLCWLFTVEGTELVQANSFGCRTPPSPGGAGPRISDLPPVIRVLRTGASTPDSPASPARERIMSEGGPKAKAKSRYT